MNCPQQNNFLWIVATGKCLGKLNSSLYYGSLRSGTAGGCNIVPLGTKKGKKTRREDERIKMVQKRQTIQQSNRVQLGTQKEVLKHYSGNIVKCKSLVQRCLANCKFDGFCKAVWFLQTDISKLLHGNLNCGLIYLSYGIRYSPCHV